MGRKSDVSECFYGSVTVGDRGQIVIPAEAREFMGIKAGDKLLVMQHPEWNALMITSFAEVRSFIDDFTRMIAEAETQEEPES